MGECYREVQIVRAWRKEGHTHSIHDGGIVVVRASGSARSASLALLDAAARRISDTVAPCFARRSSSLSGHPPTLPVSTAAYYANPPLSSNVTVRRGGREAPIEGGGSADG